MERPINFFGALDSLIRGAADNLDTFATVAAKSLDEAPPLTNHYAFAHRPHAKDGGILRAALDSVRPRTRDASVKQWEDARQSDRYAGRPNPVAQEA